MSKNFDHEKAVKISKEVDPDKDFYEMIVDKIHDAPGKYTLKGLVESLGTKSIYYTPKEAIAMLEAIYEALREQQQFILTNRLDLDNVDDLFNETFNKIYEIAENHHKVELLAALNDCCMEGD